MQKKKYCVSGNVLLNFTQTIELTDEEFNTLENSDRQCFGSKAFGILFDNVNVSDYECSVDEYELLDIERIDD